MDYHSTIKYLKPDQVEHMFHMADINDIPVLKCFSDLLESLPEFSVKSGDKHEFIRMANSVSAKLYHLHPNQAHAVEALFKAVQSAIHRSFTRGKDYGKQALIQLNNGSMSMKEFEEL